MIKLLPLVVFGVVQFVFGSPVADNHELKYHSLHARQQNLPLLKLPYGTWQATKYDSKNDVSTM
jgi:hypothetical protein